MTAPTTASGTELANGLLEGLSGITAVVEDIAELIRRDAAPLPSGELGSLAGRVARLQVLNQDLQSAIRLLRQRDAHALWDARFSAAGWESRRLAIADAIARDRAAGTTLWLGTITDAVTQGCWAEARRLCRTRFALHPDGSWYQDRWLSAVRAVEGPLPAGTAVPEQVVDIVEWGMQNKALTPEQRVALAILGARVLAGARDDRSVAFLKGAEQLQAEAGDSLAQAAEVPTAAAVLRHRILAAWSFVDRRGVSGVVEPPAGWDVALSSGSSCLDCVVELAARRQSGEHDQASESASELASGVSTVAGLGDRLLALRDVPPPALMLSFASRLLSEDRAKDAEAILERVSPTTPRSEILHAELAYQVLARLDPGPEEAVAAATVARKYLAEEQGEQAITWFRTALAHEPEEPSLQRELADALVYSAWTLPAPAGDELLHEALALCEQAELRSPLTPDDEDGWAMRVQSNAESRLALRISTERPRHAWAAVDHAARYAAFNPTWSQSWVDLADRLSAVCAGYTVAEAMARARALDSEGADTLIASAVAEMNIGEAEVAESLLRKAAPDIDASASDQAWHRALSGMAARMRGDYEGAARHLEAALALDVLFEFRVWLAECLTIEDDGAKAGAAWSGVWREVPLDPQVASPLQLGSAAWAALYQGQVKSALELASRIRAAEAGDATERAGGFVSGLALLILGDAGEEVLSDTFGWMNVAARVEDQRLLCRAVVKQAVSSSSELGDSERRSALERALNAIERCAAEQQAQLGQETSELTPAQRELDWLESRLSQTVAAEAARNAIGRLRTALGTASTGDADPHLEHPIPERSGPGEDLAGGYRENADDVIRIATPPSWFAGYEGRELEHVMFRRASPDARAAVDRLEGVDSGASVRVRVDGSLEPDWVMIEVPARQPVRVRLGQSAAYLPPGWRASIDSARADSIRPDDELPLLMVRAATNAVQRLSSWSAEETAFRLALLLPSGRSIGSADVDADPDAAADNELGATPV